MKIAYDAKRLFYNHTGLGNYARSLVRQLRRFEPDLDIYLFSPEIEGTEYKDFLENGYKVISGDRKILWRYSRMVRDLAKVQPAIYHGLSNELPRGIGKLTKMKSIVTIHDLIFIKYPELYPFFDRMIYREKFRRACLSADHIVAVSEATKADIIELFQVSEEKITVIYQSCSELFYQDSDSKPPIENYGLFVSTISKRKNLKMVIEAMRLIPSGERPVIKVVGAGNGHKRELQDLIALSGLKESFEFSGSVSLSELKSLYERACFSIYPSLYEGFGIPVVESLLCGTPVITSNLSSMPEAASGLGELVDPTSPLDIKNKIQKLCTDRSRIAKKDIEYLRKKFAIEKHATLMLELYDNVLCN